MALADKYTRTAAASGLPASRCLQVPKDQFGLQAQQTYHCALATGRYVIEVVSPDEAEAHQKLAAQYLMLTAK